MKTKLIPILVVLSGGVVAGTPSDPIANDKKIDFKYSLPWWQSSPNMPDDPDKPLVGKEGQFFYDFGGGGPRKFAFSVTPVIEGAQWKKQETITAKTPIIQTWWEDTHLEIRTDAFIAIPREDEMLVRLDRVGGEIAIAGYDGPKVKRHVRNWAKPRSAVDASFSSIALSKDARPIEYNLRVGDDKLVEVVLGFCEGYWAEAGKRVMEISVEGGEKKNIDPARDFGKNAPGLYRLKGRDVNNDGRVHIKVSSSENASDKTVVLNSLWAFSGDAPADDVIMSGQANDTAYAFADCGVARFATRRGVCVIHLTNTSTQEITRSVKVKIEGEYPVEFIKNKNLVSIGSTTDLQASHAISSCEQKEKVCTVELAPVEIPAGQTRIVALTIHRYGRAPMQPYTVEQALAETARAWNWWENQADLPWDRIQIPDPAIQQMLHSCIRNLWQARDIEKELPAFHVGPTMYRCLWIVDGAFMLETAAMLGRAKDARAGIDYMLSFQEDDGGFQLKARYWKEGGLVMWTVIRHAMMTNDKEWLRERWPSMVKTFAWLKSLRNLEGAADKNALEYRLLPWGDIDGGISNTGKNQKKGEYSNIYWSLIGMKSAIQAAQWLGEEDTARAWQAEYDDFDATFRKAAKRDLKADQHGNKYLPIIMGDVLKVTPQRAQWAFCHAVYPGQLFSKEDPVAVGTLNAIKAAELQGLIYGTGWDPQGIWTYFASFYGHALLWQGQGEKAAQVLYDFANHAVPTRVWREEQRPVGKGGHEVGDMPHNWASAEFIRLAVHLLQIDRGDELHLLEAIPKEWLKPGMVTRLNGVATPFGSLTMKLNVSDDGKTAKLIVEPLTGPRCQKLVVHLGDWGSVDNGSIQSLNPRERHVISIQIRE